MDYIHQREQQPRQQEIESSPIDVLIALHACDMATDEAIFCGISSRSQIIVTAPCCHKEVRGQMDAFFSRPRDGLAEPLNDLLRYGIFREREAEMVTGVCFPIYNMHEFTSTLLTIGSLGLDSIRALLLEWAGYEVKVMEFVSGEHTAKNVMISAVKNKKNVSEVERTRIKGKLENLMATFGVTKHRLYDLLLSP